jgi:hypothetical protein
MTPSGFLPDGDLNLLLLHPFYARRTGSDSRRARRAAHAHLNSIENQSKTDRATAQIPQYRCATEQNRLRNGQYSLNALRTKTPIPCATAESPP